MLLELDGGAARQEPEAAFPGGAQSRTLSLALAHGLVYHVAFAWLSDSFSRLCIRFVYVCRLQGIRRPWPMGASPGRHSIRLQVGTARAEHDAEYNSLLSTCPGLQGPSVGRRELYMGCCWPILASMARYLM